MSRKKLIAANWKLNPSSREEAIDLIENIKLGLKNINVEEKKKSATADSAKQGLNIKKVKFTFYIQKC